MVAKGETAKRDEGRMGGSFRAAKGDGVGKSVGEEGGAIDGGTVFRRQAHGGGPFDRCPRGDRLAGQQPASLTRNPGQPEQPLPAPEARLADDRGMLAQAGRDANGARVRSEESRVGEEGVRTCRSRWLPYN